MDERRLMIVENFIPKPYQEDILNLLTSEDFPWFYHESISGSNSVLYNDHNLQYGFSHVFFNEGKENSPFYKFLIPLTYFIEEKMNKEVKEIIRVRAGMNTRVSENINVHNPHIDYQTDHNVLLYYVNNSDGDTIIYNEKKEKDVKKFSIMNTISPKMGRATIFNGLHYHSSSSPIKNSKRIVLNINFR
jgi:hypothetical protein